MLLFNIQLNSMAQFQRKITKKKWWIIQCYKFFSVVFVSFHQISPFFSNGVVCLKSRKSPQWEKLPFSIYHFCHMEQLLESFKVSWNFYNAMEKGNLDEWTHTYKVVFIWKTYIQNISMKFTGIIIFSIKCLLLFSEN